MEMTCLLPRSVMNCATFPVSWLAVTVSLSHVKRFSASIQMFNKSSRFTSICLSSFFFGTGGR